MTKLTWRTAAGIVAILLLIGLNGGQSRAAESAPAAPTAGISGRVTDEQTGAGISGVDVLVARQDGTGRATATTDADGKYALESLAAGVYSVSFAPPPPYFPENYDDFAPGWGTPNFVSVAAGQTATGIDASLAKGLVISGTVSAEADGSPLANVTVQARGHGSPNPSQSVNTGPDGSFTLGPLWPDNYLLFFRSNDSHASEWYDSAARPLDAKWLELNGDVTGLAVQLAPGGQIHGRITDPNGQPVPFASVGVHPVGSPDSLAIGFSDADGRYATAPGLPAGWYQVRAGAGQLAGTASTWHGGGIEQSSAQAISVTAGIRVENVDIQLAQIATGSISGTVQQASGRRGIAAWVTARDADRRSVASQFTQDGNFLLDGLPPGEYRVEFSPGAPHPIVWYDGQASFETAGVVQVAAGETAQIVQTLQPPGGISGTVTAQAGERSGAPVPGTLVQVWPIASGQYTPTAPLATATTGLNGQYELGQLLPGTYRVRFLPPNPYLSQWYAASDFYASAQAVTVAPGAVTGGIDGAVAEGVVITGRLLAADTGAPLVGVPVIGQIVSAARSGSPSPLGIHGYGCDNSSPGSLLDSESKKRVGAVKMSGRFGIPLPRESIAIFCVFTPELVWFYLSQFFPGGPMADTAQRVETGTAASKDIGTSSASSGSRIKLQLRTSTPLFSQPISGMIVRFVDPQTRMERRVVSDGNGTVTLPAFPAGSHRIVFGRLGEEIREVTIEVDGEKDVCKTLLFDFQELPNIINLPFVSNR